MVVLIGYEEARWNLEYWTQSNKSRKSRSSLGTQSLACVDNGRKISYTSKVLPQLRDEARSSVDSTKGGNAGKPAATLAQLDERRRRIFHFVERNVKDFERRRMETKEVLLRSRTFANQQLVRTSEGREGSPTAIVYG